jgi:hypothetical protein
MFVLGWRSVAMQWSLFTVNYVSCKWYIFAKCNLFYKMWATF